VSRRKSQDSVLSALDFCHQSEPIMAIFQCYFDESGKFKDHEVISFCGLCSPLSRVQEFEEEWKRLLRSCEIESLSMKKALRRSRRLSLCIDKQSAQERTEILKPFALCIRKHFEIGVAIAVDVKAYQQISAVAKKQIGGSDDPYYLAFLCGIMGPSRRLRDEDKMHLICDDDENTALNCYRLYRRVKIVDPTLRHRLVALTFASDKEFVPLQAADMLSSLVRLQALRQFRNEYFEYVSLFHALTVPSESITNGIKWVKGFFGQENLKLTERGMESIWQTLSRYDSA
jgi:hypothetical protein